jgi:hypothetical protein
MKNRFLSPTPKFWKKVRNIAISITTAAGVVIALPTMGLPVIPILLTVSNYIVAIGTAVGITAQATKE